MKQYCLLTALSIIVFSPPGHTASTDTVSQSFEYFAPINGLVLEKGVVTFATAQDCAELPTCYGNNPTSPYGVPQFKYAGNTSSPNNSGYWQLTRDEAVVLIVETPPETAYFGYTHYVHDRYYPSKGARLTTFASLGDTINNLTIRHNNQFMSSFEKLTAVVMTASLETYGKVATALSSSGLKPERINVQVIPYGKVIMGNSATADAFRILARIAKPTDQVSMEDYIANPPIAAYKATAVNSTFTSITPPALRPKGTGTNENGLFSLLSSLESAIKARFSPMSAVPIAVTPSAMNPDGCLESGLNCNGDNRDALYEVAVPGVLDPSKSDFVIVYGVNHTATKKATYTNFSIYDLNRLAGVSSVIDDEYADSGKYYLGAGYPGADKVYAYKVARFCYGEPFCIEIPFEGALSIPADQPIMIALRSYLEAATKTGPLGSELLRARAIRFRD
ncbi:MAG: hypothetical protein ABL958_06270 [Bdellovibrionia bacterium]